MLKLSDSYLWGTVIALSIISLMAIFSTTFRSLLKAGIDPLLLVKRQFFSLLIGYFALTIFAYFDYKHLQKNYLYTYGAIIFLLLIVLFVGSNAQGAQRWLQIGAFSFQPSEVSKLGIIIVLASFLNLNRKARSFMESALIVVLSGIPFLLIFKQPDLGTALVFGVILLGLLAASNASPKLLLFLVTPIISIFLRPVLVLWIIYLLALALYLFLTRADLWDWLMILGSSAIVGIALPFFWNMLKAYQQQRIIAFLNPSSDPFGAGYHALQSMIAVGSGGLIGKGFLRGTQTQLQFIPEQHSDFIFSSIGEEFGFIGALFVVVLYAIIAWRALTIALEARDYFGFLVASGISVMIVFHVLANIGMVIGLLPVVGIPLPFLSYGGTSLMVNLAAVGILQSIAMRRQKIIF